MGTIYGYATKLSFSIKVENYGLIFMVQFEGYV